MYKRSLVCIIVMLLVSATGFAAVGQFDASENIGYPDGMDPGWTTYDNTTSSYMITGGGGDLWDNYDQFTYAYKSVTGSMRMTAYYQWMPDMDPFFGDWGKMGTMLRYTTDPRSQHMTPVMRRGGNGDYVGVQYRSNYDGGSGDYGNIGWQAQPIGLGIERVQYGVLDIITPLYNYGDGWKSFGSQVRTGMPDTVLFGSMVMSGEQWRWGFATAKVTDVTFSDPIVPKVGPASCDPPAQKGFLIRTLKWDDFYGAPPYWGYGAMDEALDTGMVAGIAVIEEGTRVDPYVNLYDSGGRGNFTGATEVTYPGIDAYVVNPSEPGDGDDDDNTATEIIACMYLTEGYHIIGINSDDGGILKIGGVEVGRTGEWKGSSDVDFLFKADAAGWYPLNVRHMEGGGGASIELSYVLMDGTRILLGDPRGPEVRAIPEPATIALLSLGGLLLGIRRKR
jgi:hypothetical protein